MNSTTKPTPIYWLISILALLWNCIGIVAYLGQAYMTDEALKMLPETNQLYFSNIPAWVTAAFALAVFGGFFGCLGLLFKKKWAYFLFILSLLALLVHQTYNVFIQDFIEMTGDQMILPLLTFIVASYLVYFSKQKVELGILG
jgi:hypothetical protein